MKYEKMSSKLWGTDARRCYSIWELTLESTQSMLENFGQFRVDDEGGKNFGQFGVDDEECEEKFGQFGRR